MYVVDERTTKEKLNDWKNRQVERAKNGLDWCDKARIRWHSSSYSE